MLARQPGVVRDPRLDRPARRARTGRRSPSSTSIPARRRPGTRRSTIARLYRTAFEHLGVRAYPKTDRQARHPGLAADRPEVHVPRHERLGRAAVAGDRGDGARPRLVGVERSRSGRAGPGSTTPRTRSSRRSSRRTPFGRRPARRSRRRSAGTSSTTRTCGRTRSRSGTSSSGSRSSATCSPAPRPMRRSCRSCRRSGPGGRIPLTPAAAAATWPVSHRGTGRPSHDDAVAAPCSRTARGTSAGPIPGPNVAPSPPVNGWPIPTTNVGPGIAARCAPAA